MTVKDHLVINRVTKHYKKFRALDNVSLNIEKGEFLTILGPSGSGKTTLLKVIAGFEGTTSGYITLNSQEITTKKAYEREIGMLFQNYALFPHMSVFDNIAYPLKLRKLPKTKITELVNEVLELVHMESYATRLPKQLSGGQQQRVALARAIVYRPPLLLLDEPLSALDKSLRQQMQMEIKHIQRKVGITTICVTHDQEEAITMSDRICVMNEGRIEQIDNPKKLYNKPENEFVAKFIGEINLIKVKIADIVERKIVVTFDDKSFTIENEKEIMAKKNDFLYMAIRPENVHIAESNSPYEISIEAVTKEIIYMGDSYKIKTTTDTGNEINIKVASRLPNFIEEGQKILLGWDANEISLLTMD